MEDKITGSLEWGSGVWEALVINSDESFCFPNLSSSKASVTVYDTSGTSWLVHIDASIALMHARGSRQTGIPSSSEVLHAINNSGELVLVLNKSGLFMGWAARVL